MHFNGLLQNTQETTVGVLKENTQTGIPCKEREMKARAWSNGVDLFSCNTDERQLRVIHVREKLLL